MSSTRKLTLKQQRFVDNYLIYGNATRAAIEAGYSPKTAGEIGRQNLGKLAIAGAIAEAGKAAADRNEVTTDLVIQGLLTEANFKGKGSSHGARVAAWAHLGKYRGMFVDRVDLNVEPSAIEFIVAEPGDTELEVRDVPYLRIEDSGSNGSEDEGAA